MHTAKKAISVAVWTLQLDIDQSKQPAFLPCRPDIKKAALHWLTKVSQRPDATDKKFF